MNQETKGKLEVSRDVVEQLNGMVRNSSGPAGYNHAPRTPGPGPSPSISLDGAGQSYED